MSVELVFVLAAIVFAAVQTLRASWRIDEMFRSYRQRSGSEHAQQLS